MVPFQVPDFLIQNVSQHPYLRLRIMQVMIQIEKKAISFLKWQY